MADLPDKPTMSINDYPLIGRFVRDPVQRRTKYGPKVWGMMEELNQFNMDLNMYKNAGMKEEYTKLLTTDKQKYVAYQTSKPYANHLSDLNKQMKQVWTMDKSEDWKKEQLDKLVLERNSTHKKMYDALVKALK